jgi:hypothetical protein
MKSFILRFLILLAAFVVGVTCFVALRRQPTPCVRLNPADSQVQFVNLKTGKTFRVKTCPR